MIDYAHHLIRMESLLKQAHDLCLMKEYDRAAQVMIEVTAESRLLTTTLREMEKTQNARAV